MAKMYLFLNGLLPTGSKARSTVVRGLRALIRFPIRWRPAPDGLESPCYGRLQSTASAATRASLGRGPIAASPHHDSG